MKDTGAPVMVGVLFMAEGQLLCNLMRGYMLRKLHLKFNIYMFRDGLTQLTK